MSYYKYAERDADSQVNWGKITRDMTNMLDEQKKLKQENKRLRQELNRKDRVLSETAALGTWKKSKYALIRT